MAIESPRAAPTLARYNRSVRASVFRFLARTRTRMRMRMRVYTGRGGFARRGGHLIYNVINFVSVHGR